MALVRICGNQRMFVDGWPFESHVSTEMQECPAVLTTCPPVVSSLFVQLTSPDEFGCVVEGLQDLLLPLFLFFFFVPFLNQAQSVSTVLTLFGLYGFIFKCANCVLLQLKLFIHHNDLASSVCVAL